MLNGSSMKMSLLFLNMKQNMVFFHHVFLGFWIRRMKSKPIKQFR